MVAAAAVQGQRGRRFGLRRRRPLQIQPSSVGEGANDKKTAVTAILRMVYSLSNLVKKSPWSGSPLISSFLEIDAYKLDCKSSSSVSLFRRLHIYAF